jgi:hypothetical protein
MPGVMDYCCAGEYGLVENGSVSGAMAAARRSRLLRWHAVRITDGKPEDRAVDGFRYAEAESCCRLRLGARTPGALLELRPGTRGGGNRLRALVR